MSYSQHLYDKAGERRAAIELAAKVVGYELSWSADQSLCWLAQPYDGRLNTDDAWAPDRVLSDAASLAIALGLTVAVSDHAVHVSHRTVHAMRATFSFGEVDTCNEAYIRAVFYVATKMGQYQNILPPVKAAKKEA